MNPQSAYENRTEKLYESDGLLSKFEATVIACDEAENGFDIELDRTAFFPEGGGQDSDTGLLDGSNVKHVRTENGRILHLTDKPLSVGSTIKGALDFDLRRKRMQNHGGEHIISGLIYSNFGIGNVGFHMSENEITIDTASPVTEEMLDTVETLANRAVWENRPIRCYYPSRDELESLPYRSKTEIDGDVRIVEIDGCDRCACCAPHFPSTAPIGLIHIKSFIKYKKGSRLTVVCGEDALQNYRTISKAAKEIGKLYSVQSEEIHEAVLRREEAFADKLGELRDVKEKLLAEKLRSIEPTDKSICVFENGCDTGLLRKLVNDGIALTNGVFAAFSDNGKGGYNYVVGTKEGDLAPLAVKMREELGGRGGGKGTMITGFVESDEENIQKFFS